MHQQGYALNDQELEMGLRSLAVPLYNPQGQVEAALNVGFTRARCRPAKCWIGCCRNYKKAARELTLLLR